VYMLYPSLIHEWSNNNNIVCHTNNVRISILYIRTPTNLAMSLIQYAQTSMPNTIIFIYHASK